MIGRADRPPTLWDYWDVVVNLTLASIGAGILSFPYCVRLQVRLCEGAAASDGCHVCVWVL
jgi:hypothetical protein